MPNDQLQGVRSLDSGLLPQFFFVVVDGGVGVTQSDISKENNDIFQIGGRAS